MTSGEYLKQLEKYLRKLPQSDYEDAMEYLTEYFADAGPENEQAVIKELGTPKQAAAELMRNLLDKKVDGEETLCESIAPGNPKVGVMMPYAPVQLLLFTYDDGIRMPSFLVMTSGNTSGAPICRED